MKIKLIRDYFHEKEQIRKTVNASQITFERYRIGDYLDSTGLTRLALMIDGLPAKFVTESDFDESMIQLAKLRQEYIVKNR